MHYTEFASLMREKRKALGILEKDMALKCCIEKSRYSRLERGVSEPTFLELITISRELKIDLTRLFDLTKDDKNKEKHIPYYD